MQEENKKPVEKLDIYELLKRFWKHLRHFWAVPMVLLVLFAAFSYIRARKSFRPMYESRAIFTVTSGYAQEDLMNTAYYDNAAAQQLAAALPHMLNTDLMRDMMKVELNKPYINGRIIPKSAVNTNLFTLRVESASAQDAYDVLWAVIKCYPQVASYMVDDPAMVIREEPNLPTEPFNSFSWKGPVVSGGAKGLILGLGLLLILTFLDQRVSSVKQLKKLVNLPILATFPQVRQKKRRSRSEMLISAASDRGMGESLRSLSAKVKKAMASESQKVLLITSTYSGEGKTTVAANLALTLAKEGKSVVLVDADLRKQSVATRLGQQPGEHGLIDCMRNSQLPLLSCLGTVPGSSLMYLSGKSLTNRRYNIDARNLHRVLDELSEKFEYVILDTSPCVEVADTALLCHFVKGVLYVVRPEVPRQNQLLDVINSLYEQGASLTGLVVNGVEQKHGSYGYGYRYGYGYYGSRYGGKSKYGYGEKAK